MSTSSGCLQNTDKCFMRIYVFTDPMAKGQWGWVPRSYEKFVQQTTKEGKSVIKQFTGGRVPPTDPTLVETSFPSAPSWPCFLSVSLMTLSSLPLWMSASCRWFPNLHFQPKTPSRASCLLVELLATIFILMSQKISNPKPNVSGFLLIQTSSSTTSSSVETSQPQDVRNNKSLPDCAFLFSPATIGGCCVSSTSFLNSSWSGSFSSKHTTITFY